MILFHGTTEIIEKPDVSFLKKGDMYFRGIRSKKETLDELRYYKMND